MDHIIKFPRPYRRRPNPEGTFAPLLAQTLRITFNIGYGIELVAILGTGDEKDNAHG